MRTINTTSSWRVVLVAGALLLAVGCTGGGAAGSDPPPEPTAPSAEAGAEEVGGAAQGDVPDGWQRTQVEGLELAHPADWIDSPDLRAQVPEAVLALEGADEGGVRPGLFVTAATPGSTTDLDARRELVGELLPDLAPGAEISEESRIDVAGGGSALVLRYVYPKPGSPYSTAVLQVLVAAGDDGWGLQYVHDSELFAPQVAEGILASLRVVGAGTS